MLLGKTSLFKQNQKCHSKNSEGISKFRRTDHAGSMDICYTYIYISIEAKNVIRLVAVEKQPTMSLMYPLRTKVHVNPFNSKPQEHLLPFVSVTAFFLRCLQS